MPLTVIGFPETIAAIRRYGRDGVAATNKPVTLRWALARIGRGMPRLMPFAEAEAELRPLLDELARPGTTTAHRRSSRSRGSSSPEPSSDAWRVRANLAWHRRNVFVTAGALP